MNEIEVCPFCGYECEYNDSDSVIECVNGDCGCVFDFTGLYYGDRLSREEEIVRAFNNRIWDDE